MSDLSDFTRMVHTPAIASLEARIRSLAAERDRVLAERDEATEHLARTFREMFPNGPPPDDQLSDEEAAAIAFLSAARNALAEEDNGPS